MAGTNWAGNLAYGSVRTLAPATVAEVQEAVGSSARLRVVGTRHTFNGIADTTGTHLSLENMRRVLSLDTARRQVTVEGGTYYSNINPWLHEHSYALTNLASLHHLTIAGACATASHGSGTKLGNLATAVAAIEFVDGAGKLVSLSREGNPDIFPGVPVGLGALGVVTSLTLDLQPGFAMRQDVYCDLPMGMLATDFDAIMASGYSVSLFTNWQSDVFEQVWVKNRVDSEAYIGRPSFFGAQPSFFGATPAGEKMHPVPGADPITCTEQMGTVGPSYDRLPHFRIDIVPTGGGDYQAEYFVASEHAVAAVEALRRWGRARLAPLLMVSEIRTIAEDDLWLSPCYGRPCVAFHFSFRPDQPAIMELLPSLEAALEPFAPVPHWGKLFTMDPETVRARLPMLGAFRRLLDRYDPAGKFRNAFIDRLILGGA